MTTPYITVLIDTYNYGEFVEEAIQSVIDQTYPAAHYEIVVVDDGSTDDTPRRVKRFGGRVCYFPKENGGQASAFNFGIAQARGEFVCLLDADDVWLPNKLERVAQAIASNSDAVHIYDQPMVWDSEKNSVTPGGYPLQSGTIPESSAALLSHWMVPASSLAFRRATLDALLPIPEVLRTQADAYLSGLIIFLGPVVGISESLTKYRIHGQNLFAGPLTPEKISHRIEMRANLVASLKAWLSAHGHNPDAPFLSGYFQQWQLAQELDSFVLLAPNRLQFFAHQYRRMRTYKEIMGSGERNYARLRAAAGLLLGYSKIGYFDRWWAGWRRFRSKDSKLGLSRTPASNV